MARSTLLLISLCALFATLYAVSEQQHLLDLVNQYRNEHGLPSIPTSYWLTATAMMKTIDRRDNGLPEEYGCVSGHSWSGKSPLFSGPCCYSGAQWECMCLKPNEISNGRFSGIAYENWVRAPNAEVAVNAWKGSPSHNELMLNLNGWAGSTWKSMGAFTCEYYYSLWFSESEDPDAGANIDFLTCGTNTNTAVTLPNGVPPPQSTQPTQPSPPPQPTQEPTPPVTEPTQEPTPPVPQPQIGEPKLWMGGHTVQDSSWNTITLNQRFEQPVVVCSLYNTKDSASMTVRMRNVNTNSFEVQVIGINGPMNGAVDIDCIAVESGVYTDQNNGIKFEAGRIDSSITNSKNNWDDATNIQYSNSYSNPIVLGQVMSANDPNWSAFYARGSSSSQPVDSSNCYIGKHVGEDSNTNRATEQLGYIIMEARAGSWNGRTYDAIKVSTIGGVDDSAPYQVSTGIRPNLGVTSVNSVVDNDGGFSILYGGRYTALVDYSISLGIDEDQFSDAERSHSAETVAVLVFGH